MIVLDAILEASKSFALIGFGLMCLAVAAVTAVEYFKWR
jgi:hypothetical protein